MRVVTAHAPRRVVAHEDTFLLQLLQRDYPLVHQCILLGVPESLKTPQGQKEFDDVLSVRSREDPVVENGAVGACDTRSCVTAGFDSSPVRN